MKYDIKVDKFDTSIQLYTLPDVNKAPLVKIDLYLLNERWTINWGAYGNQNTEFANEFMAVMKKAIEMMGELNTELLDKALDGVEL